MADFGGYTLTRVHDTDFYVDIAKGRIAEHSFEFKFGFNSSVSSTLGTVWAHGGLYGYPDSSGSAMTISSNSTEDSSAGVGARTVAVRGLDDSQLLFNETASLDGKDAVALSNTVSRVFRAEVLTTGSSATNIGDIFIGTGSVSSGEPANIFTRVVAEDAQTLQSFYTVPSGKTGYLTHLVGTTFGNSNVGITTTLVARKNMGDNGEPFAVKDKFILSRNGLSISHKIPIKFNEKTDIEIRGQSDGVSGDLSAGFEIFMVDN